MAGQASIGGHGLSDALTILGAAGIVIPAFARLKVSPVIGFIIVGIIAGPYALGALARAHPWLHAVSISDPAAIEPFAELGIILLLFSAGLHISFRRLRTMGRTVFGLGSAELLGCAVLIAAGLLISGSRSARQLRSASGWRCPRPRWCFRSPASTARSARAPSRCSCSRTSRWSRCCS